ncbi:MAG TPA: DUF3108 domain-containing protein, partial [Pyrinomonadaceae bacterium]|nr:DUF3108 domain-containing protein [Pyrinomonadaceae bacterium]
MIFRQPLIASRVAALLLAVCCLSSAAFAQRRTTEVGASPFSSAPYQTGEQITYNVSFANFVTAGHVELFVAGRSTFGGREGIELRAHVETVGVVSTALYAINNEYTTFVDPASGVPFRAQQVIREGGQQNAAGANPANAVNSNFFGGYDFVSALYRLRALPLAEGSAYHLLVSDRSNQYDAEVRVVGRESVKTALGSYNAIVTETRVPNNPPLNNYRLRIYFSDGAQHLPVLITARLPVGEVRAEIASLSIVEPAS